MYFADVNSGFKVNSYGPILNRLIRNEEVSNREEIIKAIKQAISIHNGEMRIDEIDSDYFSFITTLVSEGSDILDKIDIRKIDKSDFELIVRLYQ